MIMIMSIIGCQYLEDVIEHWVAVGVIGLLLAWLQGDHAGPGVANVSTVSPDDLVNNYINKTKL